MIDNSVNGRSSIIENTQLTLQSKNQTKMENFNRNNLSVLTPFQKRFYEENGYILVKRNVDTHLLDTLKDHFIDICNGKADKSAISIIMRDPSLKGRSDVKGEYLINKIQDFLYDEKFWLYFSNKNVVDVVQDIIGPNITGMNSMLINKPPNANPESSLHPLHQDLHYFPFRPADKIVASWTAMEYVDENNGCLYVVPGSHKKGQLYPHTYPEGLKKSMYHGVQGLDHLEKKFVVMEKGDTLFFHPLVLHGSGPNRTKGFRKAISCHYADSNCEFIDVKGTTQENIGDEVQKRAEIMYKIQDINLGDIWKLKSRLVRGTPGNFQKLSSNL